MSRNPMKQERNPLPSGRGGIKNKDLFTIRSRMGLLNHEFWWLIGLSAPIAVDVKKSMEKQIQPIQRSLLTRFLIKHPEYSPLPRPRSLEDMIKLVSPLWKGIYGTPLNYPTFALMMGVSAGQGRKWRNGSPPSSATTPLFIILNDLIESQGREGLILYLSLLNDFATSHGESSGFDGILEKQAWPPQDTIPMTNGDLIQIRFQLGLSIIDLCWLIQASFIQIVTMSKNKPDVPVTSRTRVIIASILLRHPHLLPLPASVKIDDLAPKVAVSLREVMGNVPQLDNLAPAELVGVACGVSRQQGAQWMIGGQRTATGDRLLVMLDRAIKSLGAKDGMYLYLELLDEEARSRGFADFLGVLENYRSSWRLKQERILPEIYLDLPHLLEKAQIL